VLSCYLPTEALVPGVFASSICICGKACRGGALNMRGITVVTSGAQQRALRAGPPRAARARERARPVLTAGARRAQHAAGGLAGLVFAMLMEAVLLIIRTSVPYELPRRATLTLAAAPPGGARRGGGAGGAEEPEQAAAARRAPGRRRAPRQEAALKKAQ